MSETRDRALAARHPNKIAVLWDRVVRRIRSSREKRTDKQRTAAVCNDRGRVVNHSPSPLASTPRSLPRRDLYCGPPLFPTFLRRIILGTDVRVNSVSESCVHEHSLLKNSTKALSTAMSLTLAIPSRLVSRVTAPVFWRAQQKKVRNEHKASRHPSGVARPFARDM